jgi:hypothetical protein
LSTKNYILPENAKERLNRICSTFKIIQFFIKTLVAMLYVRVRILLTCGKHVHKPKIPTVSEKIKLIDTLCETGQISSSKARFSTGFQAPTMCNIFSNNVRILSIYDSYLMGITYEYFRIISPTKNTTLSEQFKNSIEKIVGRGKIDTTNAHIHDHSLSWLGTYTSKKVAGLSCFCGPLLVR